MTIGTPRLEERLERGEIVTFEPCPTAVPTSDDLAFLMQQQLSGVVHKNISYNPTTHAVSGFTQQTPQQAERLQTLLREFSQRACEILARLLPQYARAWQPD